MIQTNINGSSARVAVTELVVEPKEYVRSLILALKEASLAKSNVLSSEDVWNILDIIQSFCEEPEDEKSISPLNNMTR